MANYHDDGSLITEEFYEKEGIESNKNGHFFMSFITLRILNSFFRSPIAMPHWLLRRFEFCTSTQQKLKVSY
jgi:hypothetical protein